MNTISIFGNNYQEEYLEELGILFGELVSHDFRVYVKQNFGKYLRDNSVPLSEKIEFVEALPTDTECVLSIGGDGTFLRASEWVGASGVPILGINTGHLGFLASYYLNEVDDIINVLKSDNGTRENRALLEVKCSRMPEGFLPYALNEVVIQRGSNATMVSIHAEIDDHFLADYLADGLVVSTPTGSTAYNLSIGGPILQPTLRCFVISPIAPHSLTMRPLVVAGDSRLKFSATSRSKEVRVSLDGRDFAMPCEGDYLEVTRAPFTVQVLRRPDASFSRLLRNKLLWGK